MKNISFVITLILHFFIIYSLKLLDNFSVIILEISILIMMGFIIVKFSKNKSSIKSLGFGILYGSITSLILLLSFSIWLNNNFPG